MEIITLVGSTNFKEDYERINRVLTLEGNVVFSCGVFRPDFPEIEQYRDVLMRVHRKKIDLSDSIFVINKNGFISPHTKEEIEYARVKGKKIRYMEG